MDKTNELSWGNIAIMKYYADGKYQFKVLDKFDYPNEQDRFDAMRKEAKRLAGLYADFRQLWIKITPII